MASRYGSNDNVDDNENFCSQRFRVRQEVNLYFCSSVKETCSYVLLSKAFRMANASGVMRIRVICEIRGL